MPYTMVVKNEVNGLLVDNSVDSWYVALCKLIDLKDLRTSCLLNAQQQLRQEHNIDYVLTKLINDLPLMVTYISPELKVKSLKNMYLWFLYNALKRRLYSIRNMLSKKG